MLTEETKAMLARTGNPHQVFYAQRMRLAEGKGDGLDVIEVENGVLRLWVLPGRGLDLGRLSYHGVNLSFLSKGGFAQSAHYDSYQMEGLHTFAGGMLTTCGLRNVGGANECDGESFGFHGRIGQTPAEELGIHYCLDGDKPFIRITGTVREARLFGTLLELHRCITVYYGEPSFTVEDCVRNLSPNKTEIMLLYHCNIGYPLLSEDAEFLTGNKFLRPVSEAAAKGVEKRYSFKPPVPEEPEQCFYYTQRACSEGYAFGACVNEKLGLGLAVRSDPRELPLMCNWQSWASGDYAMGIEPATCYVDGRANNKRAGQLESLEAFGEKHVRLTFEALDRSGILRYRTMSKQD